MKYDLAEYDEFVLTHLIRSKKVYELAKDLKISSDDFLSSSLMGNPVYKLIAEAILQINTSPINLSLLQTTIKTLAEQLFVVDLNGVEEFLLSTETATLNEEVACAELAEFIKHRRLCKAQEQHKRDPKRLYEEMSKIAVDMDVVENKQNMVSANPFAAPIYIKHTMGIPTGFNKIDSKLYGLSKGECGLLIGHSGSGKTFCAANMTRLVALEGYKALFISLEEPYQNIVHRWYAAQFGMNYSHLHFGIDPNKSGSSSSNKLDLEAEFDNLAPEIREALGNLRIIDARAKAPVTTDDIKKILEEEAAKGFIPDLVVIDQLDYMEPLKKMPSGVQDWDK